MPKVLTIDEVAHELRVSEWTIRRAVARGDLPSFRFAETGKLLFEEAAVAKWIRQAQRAGGKKRQGVPA